MINQDKSWTVYIVECSDGTLYTGITNNLFKRILAHNRGKGAQYTKGRSPVVLKAVKDGCTKSEALKLERSIKKESKENKIQVLKNHETKI